MNWLKEHIKSKYEFFWDENVSMNEKNFYLVMMACIPIYIILALVFLYKNEDIIVVVYSLIMIVFVLCITYLAKTNHQEKQYGTFFCIVLNSLIIPLYFFVSGDIFNGVTIFFTLSIIVTVFLHSKSKLLYPLLVFDLLSDFAYIIFVYMYRDLFVKTRVGTNSTNAVTYCFEIVAISATTMCLYQTYIYRVAKRKLDTANRDISIAESSKTRFLANMTHEIRTPMNAIIGMTGLILREDLTEEARDQVNVVKNASSDLLRIINDILEFSKFDSGKVELINIEYSFSNLLYGVIDRISKEYFKDNISLHVFISSKIPNMLFGDDIRIKQVFNYILFSSLSRSEYGHVYIDIVSDTDEVNKTVLIQCKISSTGSGFSSSELSSMFNAYSNYDSRQKSNYKGMGLELNICKSILELMGGSMHVQSIEGIGTSVSFSFVNYIIDKKPIAGIAENKEIKPLVYETNSRHEYPWQKLFGDFNVSVSYARNISLLRATLESTKFTHIFLDEHDYSEVKDLIKNFECESITYVITDLIRNYGDFGECRILRAPLYSLNLMEAMNDTWTSDKYVKEKEKEIASYPGARVLVVDDSVINLKVLESLLGNYEITPRLAQSGFEAIDILKREKMDLLLLDQRMPEMDGIEVIHAIRESDSLNTDIKAVCVTADFGADTKDKLIAEGFNDYLSKPINLIYLDKVINAFLPKELRKVRKESDLLREKKTDNAGNENADIIQKDNSVSSDTSLPVFDPNIGIANLGGSKEAYLEVLSEYYKEGNEKVENLPKELEDNNISLYTTNVHALKSSSATVGAMRISPLFKKLEFAGKENNIDFINENTSNILKEFVEVLELVKEYLINENAFDDTDSFVDIDNDGEVAEIDAGLLNELLSSILSMNLRRAEEIINILSSNNYGSDLNKQINEIKNNIDGFEYMEAKAVIENILK